MPKLKITFLGGCSEIGANSVYYNFDGLGVIVDAGLHPKKKNKEAFPAYEIIKDELVDYLILTHAHTDHIGAIPYLLKYFPHVKIISSLATRDISEIMLKDTSKILNSEIANDYSEDTLDYYNKETLEKISLILKGIKYKTLFKLEGRSANPNATLELYPAGHILGASSVLFNFEGKLIFQTGDINLTNQRVLKKASPYTKHIDIIITEATNAGSDNLETYSQTDKRLAKFVNDVVNENGSVLIPSFALGKMQEILRTLYNMMRKGTIPHLPIYTGGVGRRLSKIYDKYCYSVQMVNKGFEISDIPQIPIYRDELFRGKYFKEPGIVVASNGMLHQGTISWELAKEWFKRRNYGIAFIGYQDEATPGWAVLNRNEKNEIILTTGKKYYAKCSIGDFRYTTHALKQDLGAFVQNAAPEAVFVFHGDSSSVEALALDISERLGKVRIFMPDCAKRYTID